MRPSGNTSILIRNIIFGVEDGLVSTVGFLSGIAVTSLSRATILTTGLILILVEAFSMGIGSLLSEHSTEEFEAHRETPLKRSVLAAVIMFISYLFSGLIPLSPYVFTSPSLALFISISLSLVAFVVLALVSARLFRLSPLRKVAEILLLGSLAIVIGVAIGRLLTSIPGQFLD